MTDAQLLDAIDTALEALLTGGLQSYTIGSQTFNKADLDTLGRLRGIYASKVARGSDSGRRVAEL